MTTPSLPPGAASAAWAIATCSGRSATRTVPSASRWSASVPNGVSAVRPSAAASARLVWPRNCATNSVRGVPYTSSGVPTWSMRPPCITATRSAISSASSWSWVTKTAVVPSARRMSRTDRRISARRKASSPENGSSSRSRRGRGASARARATRCCCPPESACGSRASNPVMPTSASTSATRASRAARRLPRSPNATLSATERWGNSAWSWKTNPISRRSGGTCVPSPASSRPASDTRPASSVSKPASIRSAVVLPQPDGPSSASTSPSATPNVSPLTTGSAPSA